MADTPFNGFSVVTSLAATDLFLGMRGAGGINFDASVLAGYAGKNASDGSAAAPGMAFLSDPDTGIFRPSSNILGFSTGGAERARIDGSGNFWTTSAAGWGYNRISVGGAGGLSGWFGSYDGGSIRKGYVGYWDGTNFTACMSESATAAMLFGTAGSLSMRIGASGSVSIGTTSESGKLHCFAANEGDTALTLASAGNSCFFRPDATLGFTLRYGGTGPGAATMRFVGPGDVEHFRINGSQVRPGADNTTDLGTSALRYKTVYAVTGTINTSDERAKQDIGAIPDEWLDAWGAVEWVRFKFRDAVKEKGPLARWHVGLIAQWVRDVFAERGLDAEAIGLLCFDAWEEEREPIFEDQVVDTEEYVEVEDVPGLLNAQGEPMKRFTTKHRDVMGPVQVGERVTLEEGDRWGLRYDECQAMEAAYMRREDSRNKSEIETLKVQLAALIAGNSSST